ncbi:41019_t:CDS:2, partial [Gigaspora margarita]
NKNETTSNSSQDDENAIQSSTSSLNKEEFIDATLSEYASTIKNINVDKYNKDNRDESNGINL